jgi:parallel beta-helix repeat protein
MRKAFVVTRRARRPVLHSARRRFQLERLEPRQLLSTYTVNNTLDDGSSGSLRWAIEQVDLDSSPDVIDFAIPGTGLHTITLGSSLPQITNPVLIDGTSQTGYDGTPLIAIDGSGLSASDWIFWDTAGSSTIQGLAIGGCTGAGIVMTTAGNNLVQSCYIGTPDGIAAEGNGVGIEIFGSAGNTIGGSTSSARNIISASTSQGIAIGDAQATDSNLVEGNYIGVDATGSVGMANGQNGLLLDHSAFNTISGNVISGNTDDGILIQQVNGTSTNNMISDNQIGTSYDGISAIPNMLDGIELNGVSNTTITSNVVSGNAQNGIILDPGTTSTAIQSNMIGTNPAGTLPLPNGQDGIQSVSSSGVTIGGNAQGQGNLISGNEQNGINLPVSGQTDNSGVLIEGNIIGLDAAGTATLANGGNGIFQNGSNGTTIPGGQT